MTTASTALTRIETVPSTNPIAVALRRILAWMDSRNVIVVTLPAAEQPKPTPAVENDGVLSSFDIACKVGALIWAQRSTLEVSLSYDEKQPGCERHSDHEPLTTLKLPGGITVNVRRNSYYGFTTVTAPDGQSQEIKAGEDAKIIFPWRIIQALAVVETLGIDDLLSADL